MDTFYIYLVYEVICSVICLWKPYVQEVVPLYSVCPRSSDPFYIIVTYYIKRVTTSWTHSTSFHLFNTLAIIYKWFSLTKALIKRFFFVFFNIKFLIELRLKILMKRCDRVSDSPRSMYLKINPNSKQCLNLVFKSD